MSLPPMAGPGWHPLPPPRPAGNPLDLSRLLGETITLFRRGAGPLLLLGAVAAAIGAATTFCLVWLTAPAFLTGLASLNAAGLTSPMTFWAGAGLAAALVTAQCCAMIAQVTRQLMAGLPPDLRAAWRETRTIVPRLLLPYLVLAASALVATALGVTVLLDSVRGIVFAAGDAASAGTAVLILFAGLLAGGTVAVVVGFWLRVRLFLFLPAASLEGSAGFAQVGRSWRLTRGVGGMVLSALLLAGLAEGIVGGLAGRLGNAFLSPSLSAGDIGGLVTFVTQLLPSLGVVMAATAGVTALTLPLLTVMSTLVHHRRTRWVPSG